MTRKVPEWVASHPDQSIPPRVKLRIWERCNGICNISRRRILPGEKYEFDHIVALINGGEHREHNLAPVLKEPHKVKTAEDIAEKAKVARKRMRHLGISGKKKKMGYRKFNGTVVKPRWE